MKVKRSIVLTAGLSLLLFLGLCLPVAATSETAAEVRIPLSISVSEPIAGAEFEFTLTSGLQVLAFEKAEGIMPAAVTPVVEKGDRVNLGFYSGSNEFAPEAGELDVGWLVVDYQGEAEQSVTLTEIKYVQVIDKDTTQSEIIPMNLQINVPLDGNELAEGQSPLAVWLAAAAALVLVLVAVLAANRRRKKRGGKV